jgi:methionyl aminopeptidase
VLCTSVNSEVVHGIPSPKRVLKEGDIVSVDFGALWTAIMATRPSPCRWAKDRPDTARLLKVTEASLHAALRQFETGGNPGRCGRRGAGVVEGEGFSVVRDFVGHGIGVHMHEDPQVPNFGEAGRGMKLRPGMVIAIEPMVNAGKPDVDGFGRRLDGSHQRWKHERSF